MRTVDSARTQEATQTPFTTFDGHTLAVFDWPLAPRRVPRAVVLIVHGLGEHAWRYDTLATELNAAGYAVRAYDQRGHGESAGQRGCLPSPDTLVRDLNELVEDTRHLLCRHHHLPLVLLGHSMGGLVSALWVARAQAALAGQPLPVQALVLSSPALKTDLTPVQRLLLATLPRWVPHLTVSNGLDPHALSHAADVVAAYQADPLVHDRISPRLGRFIAQGGPEVLAHAPQWRVPTLLMYAGSDLLVNPQGSHRFARMAPAGVVEAHCFEDFFHEIFHEIHRMEAVERLLTWLDRHGEMNC